ncbi:MAG: M28 family peptidase [Balneolaceae bacterium]
MNRIFCRIPVRYFILIILTPVLFLFQGCAEEAHRLSPEIHSADIEQHITWLADSTMEGRLAGSPEEAKVANYLADHFKNFGLEPGGDGGTYLQSFVLQGPMAQAMRQEEILSRNVIGIIQGTREPEQFLVIGAHFDGQGKGGIVSMFPDIDDVIHPGADDNASGTAGILELAHYFSEYRPHRTLIFIAFSGEEMGLIGSRYFVKHPVVPLDQIKAMINLDMIGRMEENELTVLGTGTLDLWEDLLVEANGDSLQVNHVSSGSGASDHTAFYDKQIPAVHIFTGTHSDYHLPGDTPDKINLAGTERIVRFVRQVVSRLDTLSAGEFQR